MQYKVELMQAAETDIENAFDWYNEKTPKVGLNFLETLERRLDFIKSFPFASPLKPVNKFVRYTLLIDFPFVIYYKIESNIIVIIAVLHTSQNRDRLHQK